MRNEFGETNISLTHKTTRIIVEWRLKNSQRNLSKYCLMISYRDNPQLLKRNPIFERFGVSLLVGMKLDK